CSPLRNPLPRDQRAAHLRAFRRPAQAVTRWLARRAGVEPDEIAWRVVEGPRFENHLGQLELDGRAAMLRVEQGVGAVAAQPPPVEPGRPQGLPAQRLHRPPGQPRQHPLGHPRSLSPGG
ncbi:MAG TPA: hypothetical protein VFS70_05440, partial [Actinomycetota bacterium]|nr:hypothetical protein [Actinomycetota bacterium]